MKKYILLVLSLLIACVVNAQQAVTIADFCYRSQQNPSFLETYSQSEIISNLRAKGFSIVKQENYDGQGAGGAIYTFVKVTLQRKNSSGKITTIVIDEYPCYITFGTLKEANAFVERAINSGYFRRSNGYISSVLETIFGVNSFRQKSRTISFSCSVP